MQKTIKILFVIDYVWDYRIPFYEKICQYFDMLFLITNRKQKVQDLKQVSKIRYIILQNNIKLLNILSKEKYDLLIWGEAGTQQFIRSLFIGLLCLLICKIRKKIYITWFGGWEFTQDDFWGRGIKPCIKRIGSRILIPFLLKRSDAIVTYGRLHREIYSSLGIKSEKIFIAPNSVILEYDEELLKQELRTIKESLKIIGKKVVLYVGRLEKRKNVELLLRAFARLRNNSVALIIIGDGSLRKYLMDLCKIMNITENVHFLGRLRRDKLAPYYFLCDVFVYPTIFEPWGLAINEAMQFGKPVIATYKTAAAYDLIIQGVNGFIIRGDDVEELYRLLSFLISNEELAKVMGEKSKQIIKEKGFTIENMVDGFQRAIKYSIKSRCN